MSETPARLPQGSAYPDMHEASIIMRATDAGLVPGAAWVCPLGILALTVPWRGLVGASIVHVGLGLAAHVSSGGAHDGIEAHCAEVTRLWRIAVVFERLDAWRGAGYEGIRASGAELSAERNRLFALDDDALAAEYGVDGE